MRSCGAIIGFCAALLAAAAMAEPMATDSLSGLALLSRCHVDLTGRRLPLRSTLAESVRKGTSTALDACLSILDGTKLSKSTGLLVDKNETSLAVLANLQRFHRTWFLSWDVQQNDNLCSEGICPKAAEMYDNEEPTLHLTRALFAEDAKYSEVLTASTMLEALRSGGDFPNTFFQTAVNGSVTTPQHNATSRTLINTMLVQRGQLWGIRKMPAGDNMTGKAGLAVYSGQSVFNTYTYPNPIYPFRSAGGGVLGSSVYMLINFQRMDYDKVQGGETMPRGMMKAALSDFACRTLPALRPADGAQYVDPFPTTATPPFRHNASCMECHASLDQGAAVYRAYSKTHVPWHNTDTQDAWLEFPVLYQWPSTAEKAPILGNKIASYYQKSPDGVLMFRSADGSLVHEPVNGIASLGTTLSQTNDFYYCAASRYFEFFTGIHVNLQDPGDPRAVALTDADKHYRDLVMGLGTDLKTHQSTRELVRRILSSETYARSSRRDPLPTN